MQIRVTATVDVERPVEEVFDFAVAPASQPLILRPAPPIPGVTKIELLDGRAPEVGAIRRVSLSDGSTLREEILGLERPRRHRYRWLDAPAAPLHLLVRAAEGGWAFVDRGDGRTRIEWTYRFDLTSPLAWPLGAVVARLFRRWMQRSLERIPAEMPPAS